MVSTLVKNKNVNDLCGVRQYKDGVTFTTFFPEADKVSLAGDFNNWHPEKTPMKRYQKKGLWRVKIPLKAGTYRYRFVVNGQWMQDPYNTVTEINPYRELNSVIKII